MIDKTKTIVPESSVGADGERSLNKTAYSIAENSTECKSESKTEGVCINASETATESESKIEAVEECKNKSETAERKPPLRKIGGAGYLPTISMSELFERVYSARPPVVEGLLGVGIYILAGAPKVGKSFLVAQMAYHVSAGRALWDCAVRRGAVLYLALEDDHRRLQSRLYRMYGEDSADELYFATYAKQLGGGLEAQLKRFVEEHPNTRLVIIDTLQKIRAVSSEKYSYANDYGDVGSLKQLADENGICILLVHHTRKQQADDPFDRVSGTTGLVGAADGTLLLQKERRTDNTATLDFTGRDEQDQRLWLRRNEERLIWELERRESELWREPKDPILERVATLVNSDRPKWSGTATELVAALGLEVKPNSLAMRLNTQAGKLLYRYNVRYESSRTHDGRSIVLAYEPAEK